MLKGIQKNMIWVRTPDNRYFESAYFVLRPERQTDKPREGDMLREAERLLSEGQTKEKPTRSRLRLLLCFFAGGFLGAAISLFVTFLLFLATQSP